VKFHTKYFSIIAKPTIMSPTHASLQALSTSFLSGFTDLSVTNLIAIRAPTCTHIFAPASLNFPSPKTNAAFAAHMTDNLAPVLAHFPVTAKEIYINETNRQITIWATAKAEFKREAMDGDEKEWDYTGEYIFILDVNDDGKIVRILEFLDSLATKRVMGLMVRAKQNLEKEKQKTNIACIATC
jgi:ketosteroid isomerase-like protein